MQSTNALPLQRIALLCIIVLMVLGCQKQEASAPSAGGSAMPPVKVDIVTIKAQSLELNETSAARVSAHRVAEVRPQVNGIILERLFEEGSHVEKGDLLYQVDPALYQAAFNSAKAQLALANANASSTRNKANRFSDLAKQNAVSQQALDDAQAAWKQAQAQIQSAKAALQKSQIDLDYTKISAPISGIISRSSVTEGALVSAQQATALATIRQLSPAYVDIKRSAANVMKTRQLPNSEQIPVQLTLEDGSLYAETGTLQFSEASVDEATGMVNTRAVFENKDRLLLPGMFVRATIATDKLTDAILAPQQGISRTPTGDTMAMVVNAENKVEPRTVQVTRTVGNQWLVNSGLNAGDRLIYSGLQKIKPGAVVDPVETPTPNGK